MIIVVGVRYILIKHVPNTYPACNFFKKSFGFKRLFERDNLAIFFPAWLYKKFFFTINFPSKALNVFFPLGENISLAWV